MTVASARIDASCHPSWRRMHTSAAGDVGQANEHAIGFICGYAAAGRHMTVPSLKCSFLLGRSNPHRIRGSLSQHASVCQIASRSVHSFVFFPHFARVSNTRTTPLHRDVCSNSPHSMLCWCDALPYAPRKCHLVNSALHPSGVA